LRIFTRLYDLALSWSKTKNAPRYLFGLSFAESFIFPIPPDFMLVPMALAQRERAWNFALIATFGSVLGAIIGYLLGSELYAQLGLPLVTFYNAEEVVTGVENWFNTYGVWVILIAGFTPVPYKLFTVTAGAMGMGLAPFILASILGRAARFYLVCGIVFYGGDPLAQLFRKYADLIGWVVVIALVILFLYHRA